jgi:hypothetical protein
MTYSSLKAVDDCYPFVKIIARINTASILLAIWQGFLASFRAGAPGPAFLHAQQSARDRASFDKSGTGVKCHRGI